MPQFVTDLNWHRSTKVASLTAAAAALPLENHVSQLLPPQFLTQESFRDRLMYFSTLPKVRIKCHLRKIPS